MIGSGKKRYAIGWPLRRSGRRYARRGAAVVEMAVVTPFLLLLLLGTIQFGYLFMYQETLTNAAREAARIGVLQGATTADIQERFLEAVSPLGLTLADATLEIEDATADNPVVTIRVQVPFEKVNLFGNWLGLNTDRTIGSVCSMRKEGVL
jgi:Flp pilus assembly protein TadG